MAPFELLQPSSLREAIALSVPFVD